MQIDKPESSESKPKRLAIGVEGGFDVDAKAKEYRYEDVNSIVIMPSKTEFPLPNPDLPELVLESVNSILRAVSAEEWIQEQAANNETWDGEKRKVSIHSNTLEQVTPAPKIPPSGWKCEKCELKTNLWLNLTDGSILCGRKFFDGSGGNNHAVEHYQEFRHPLAVKLGTITESGADVYSYPEEDMVEDPNLAKHLAHFGIDIQSLKKTEKSTIELEIDMNQKIGEWSIMQEEGHKLEPISGPGYTGLINLGNSCYMNSVLQVLFSLKEFQDRYYPPIPIYQLCDGPTEFNHQMAKLAYGLLSGRYSDPDPCEGDARIQLGIAPKKFKHHVCGQNPNFSTKRQQDAQEFFLYLIDLIERNDSDGRTRIEQSEEKTSKNNNPTKAFEFVVEDRFECAESKKVKYTHRVDYCLPLHVDLDSATNKSEVEAYKQAKAAADAAPKPDAKQPEVVRPKINLVDCIDQFARPETLKDFYSSATNSHTTAKKTTKISRFPKYFVFQMKKFQLGDDWVPRKLDVAFNVPHTLDLTELTATGLQPDEEELNEDGAPDSNEIKEDSQPTSSRGTTSIEPDPEAMSVLLSMGIEETQAITALKESDNDPQRAIDYIFNPPPCNKNLAVAIRHDAFKLKLFKPDTGPKFYQLKAFISHMGTSTMCGHYVCHIKKDDRWVIFNDSKVSISEEPPTEFGYLYFYERMFW